jgi:hypothetical protein
MKRSLLFIFPVLLSYSSAAWGFFGHRWINYHAVFLLPPELLILYKPSITFLEEHAVDPDKRRYLVPEEAPRHYIDLDHYGTYPFNELPRSWKASIEKYTTDTIHQHGVVPWWIQTMLHKLTDAFRTKNKVLILKYSAEIGHYIADAHVPLHTTRNHNGQYTGQKGIHGFWESRIPELLAEREWDFFIDRATYISNPLEYTWLRILESAKAVDSVLKFEKLLTHRFSTDQKYSFEERNGLITRQYSTAFSIAYDRQLNGMIERRMRMAIYSVACFWYTAWINAGQPNLANLTGNEFTSTDLDEFERLNLAWRNGGGEKEHQ